MAETFLSPVIQKLFDLLVEEAKSLKEVQKDVQSLQKELEIIEPFLRDAEAKSCRGELNDSSKIWLKQLREEAERIEDVVDMFVSHVEKHRQRLGFVGFLRKACCSIIALCSRHDIASEIRDIGESLRQIKDNGVNFGLRSFEQGGSSSSATVDPRIGSLFIEDDELVGIDFTSKELVTSLVEGLSTRTMISLVGEGGIGKTTLAKKVYKDVVKKGHFDCHVWITVSQSCNMEKILKIMKNEICPTTHQPGGEIVRIDALMELLQSSLTTKRYVVVFDDVWQTDFWCIIKHVLPDNGRGSRIILTTRNASVVESFKETSCDVVKELKTWSPEQAWKLFCRIAFRNYEIKGCQGCCPPNLERMSRQLLSKCQGLPLAIAVVAGLLSKREKSEVEWQKVLDNFTYEFKENTTHPSISKVLLLSYHDLPYQLKLCFLYFGVFPEDYPIDATALYILWIAEGFIKSRRDKKIAEQIAEEYLNELINRNLVSYEVKFGSGKECRVHDFLHDLILKIFDDSSFCHIFRENKLRFKGRSRRLSNYGNLENALKDLRDSNIRSIFNFNILEPLTNSILVGLFENFQLLRVLNLSEALLDNLPKEVGNLFHLRYLNLSYTKVKILPKSIGNLRNLQTLDVCFTSVRTLPIEICKLTNLRNLYAVCCDDNVFTYGVKIQEGIGRLEELQELYGVAANFSGVGIMKELQKLRKLRCLSILKVTAEMVSALGNSIDKMDNLNQLLLSGINEHEVLDLDFNISFPPLLLRYLSLSCRLRQMPRWISELRKLQGLNLKSSRLMDEPLKYLKGLPKLAYLRLFEAYDGEELHFEEGTFQKLTELQISKLEYLKVLKIDRGALPLLEKLDFGPSPLMKEMPSDIQHLQNLKSLEITDMPRGFVMALQPNGGTAHWKIQHIPSVTFWYYTGSGMIYDWYKIGTLELLQLLQVQSN